MAPKQFSEYSGPEDSVEKLSIREDRLQLQRLFLKIPPPAIYCNKLNNTIQQCVL